MEAAQAVSDRRADETPSLSLKVTFDRWPLEVDVHEMFISRRAEKRKRFAERLVQGLREQDFSNSDVSNTDKPRPWPLLVGGVLCSGLLALGAVDDENLLQYRHEVAPIPDTTVGQCTNAGPILCYRNGMRTIVNVIARG